MFAVLMIHSAAAAARDPTSSLFLLIVNMNFNCSSLQSLPTFSNNTNLNKISFKHTQT
eukprot:m.41426 g.41426  ORF g.41426 m.41426 type:complete len:58 (+) comp10498_c0_seq1:723-896(+)